MSSNCSVKGCSVPVLSSNFIKYCFTHIQEFKQFCKTSNLCVRCTSENPDKPATLSDNGLLCPICDYDEYKEYTKNQK